VATSKGIKGTGGIYQKDIETIKYLKKHRQEIFKEFRAAPGFHRDRTVLRHGIITGYWINTRDLSRKCLITIT
jgi:hypothetical protein